MARARQSALTLIAFKTRTIRCWFRFAWPVIQGHRSFGRHTNTAEIQVPLNHLQTKLSTIAKTTVLSAKSLKTPALKGHGRHRLTWRRLCLPCQASDASLLKSIAKHRFTISDAVEMVVRVWIVDKPLKKARELPLGMADDVSTNRLCFAYLLVRRLSFCELDLGTREPRC